MVIIQIDRNQSCCWTQSVDLNGFLTVSYIFIRLDFTVDWLFAEARKVQDADELKYDIAPFVKKPVPKLTRPLTVGGLDKRSSDISWKKIKNPQPDGKFGE